MRVALVTREYPALGSHGGIGTYTHNLARGLAGRGHDVTVIARADAPTAPFEEPVDQGSLCIEPVTCAERWKLPAGNRYVGMTMRALPFATAAAARYASLERRKAFDIVEVPEYQGWGLGVAMAAHCPAIVRLHTHTALVRRLNDVALDADARWAGRLEALTIRCGDRVLANSTALAGEAVRDFGVASERVEVLPLGIDTERFAPQDPTWLRTHLGLAADVPLLLYVGRLERRKGVETLIEAFARVHAQHPRAVLLLAGFSTDTGPARSGLAEVLQQRVTALGLGEHVRFLGHVAYDQLPRYYAACDVFVAPSLYEPFGMIYLEAMASGIATVGCTSGGVPEIIQHDRTGLLVPPADVDALGQTLAELLQFPAWRARIGRLAREDVVARFALPAIATRTEAHYAAAISDRRLRRPFAWQRG